MTVPAITPSRSLSGSTTASAKDADDSMSFLSDTTLDNDVLSVAKGGYNYSVNFGNPLSLASTLDMDYLSEKTLPNVPDHSNEYDPLEASDSFSDSTADTRRLARRPHLHRNRSRSPQGPAARRHHHHHPRQRLSPSPLGLRTAVEALASAIGPDNTPHTTTELDTIPCAGIRIPTGPFSGLLAWRFVVRLHPKGRLPSSSSKYPKSDVRNLNNRTSVFADNNTISGSATADDKKRRRMSLDALQMFAASANKPRGHERAASEFQSLYPVLPHRGFSASASASAASLPMLGQFGKVNGSNLGQMLSQGLPNPPRVGLGATPSRSTPSLANYPNVHPVAAQSASSLAVLSNSNSPYPEAITTNFLLDTSLSHNVISRETLEALGLSQKVVDALEASEVDDGDNIPKTMSLYLQDIRSPITFRLAAPGEPARLGVQFLEEARVNVCLGEGGRGGIIWVDRTLETRTFLRDVPRTVPLPKASLQSRVRALFGLSPLPNP